MRLAFLLSLFLVGCSESQSPVTPDTASLLQFAVPADGPAFPGTIGSFVWFKLDFLWVGVSRVALVEEYPDIGLNSQVRPADVAGLEAIVEYAKIQDISPRAREWIKERGGILPSQVSPKK